MFRGPTSPLGTPDKLCRLYAVTPELARGVGLQLRRYRGWELVMTQISTGSGPGGPVGRSWPPTEHMKVLGYTIRGFATELIAVLDEHQGNMARAYDKAMPIVTRLLDQVDLTDFGVLREGNHTPSSQWLYYDYELEVHLSTFVPGVAVPVHNHGTWEFIAPYRGEFEYTAFRRADDGRVEGQAELEVVEQRTLLPGDAAVVAPPHDIHCFTPKTEDMLLLGMNHGPLAPVRTYYDVESKTCFSRDAQAWRRSQTS
jgi:predicted metal-dependent enzyme (double-stranded beta helix superfamily)